ncbi:MAG: hypothetical protein BRC29_03085 [Nanohaloarchaea archaeon SW_7_43_1]|nr:MAG: hypothetical protein BRC29_03085 [Nanohaloarchaea archaeon SW_7_43_1]
MTAFDVLGGFVIGVVVGAGSVLFYIKWKIGRELGAMQDEMENLMNMTSEVQDMDWDEQEPDFEVEEMEDSGEE